MSKFFAIPFIICLGFFSFESKAGNVAVIDLDAVARELNMLQYLEATLQIKKDEAKLELISTQSQIRGELEKAKTNLEEAPSLELKKEFIVKSLNLKAAYQSEKQKKQREIRSQQLKLIEEFHQQLKPIALKVAREKGCSVVLTNTAPPFFAFQETADITKEVVTAAKQQGLTRTLPSQ